MCDRTCLWHRRLCHFHWLQSRRSSGKLLYVRQRGAHRSTTLHGYHHVDLSDRMLCCPRCELRCYIHLACIISSLKLSIFWVSTSIQTDRQTLLFVFLPSFLTIGTWKCSLGRKTTTNDSTSCTPNPNNSDLSVRFIDAYRLFGHCARV